MRESMKYDTNVYQLRESVFKKNDSNYPTTKIYSRQ